MLDKVLELKISCELTLFSSQALDIMLKPGFL